MAKKIQELKPDIVLKNYWSDNEQFADLFNAVLFDGETIIKADELEDLDTEESTVLENREYAESIQSSRDVIKIQKKSETLGIQFMMYGLENQERIHYAMPMRVMGYDYMAYKKQYDSNSKKRQNSKSMAEDEYISKMKRTDKFIPVITIVVYYGEKPWDGATSLHGMLNIPSKLINFISDYKMNLIEARENKLTLHNINNVDLFNLLEIIMDNGLSKKEAREKVIEYTREHKVDKSVVLTVAGATNCNIDYNLLDKKGEADMCTLFEEIAKESENKGRLEGRAEGRAEGKAEGIIRMLKKYNENDSNILIELVSELHISEDMAKVYLNNYNQGIL